MKKSILITGSTDGIGKLAAIKLAKAGHTIYIHGRKADKLKAVIAEIKDASNNENINGFVADFSDLAAVKKMASQVEQELSQLDVLINNAGVFKSPVNQTEGGYDIRFVVNYLAPYLLTNNLLPLLQKSSAPRLINLSSAAQATVSLDALQGTRSIGVQEAYAQSKLALTMWSFHLAKLYPNLTITAVNPGSLLNTNMVREAYGRSWSEADKGGNILYDLAIAEEYEGVTGKYFDNDKGPIKGIFGDAHSDAYDAGKIAQLIKLTDTLVRQ